MGWPSVSSTPADRTTWSIHPPATSASARPLLAYWTVRLPTGVYPSVTFWPFQ